MEKNLKTVKKKFILFLIQDGGYITSGFIYINVYKYIATLYAYHSKNPIKFQRKFLNEKRKERKENKKEKCVVMDLIQDTTQIKIYSCLCKAKKGSSNNQYL